MLPSAINPQCAAQSVGPVNTLVSTLIQALLAAQCALSPPEFWPPDYAEQALQGGLDAYDFVVVGAGSAGSVIASRLSENADWKVLVLEAGGDPPQETEIPNLLFTMQHTSVNWNYWTERSDKACLAVRNKTCYWPRGKVIGGTGSINAMLYVRGNRQDFDRWLAKGNIGWGWDDVVPYFEKSIRAVGNATHPQGYVTLNDFEEPFPAIRAIISDGAAELGVPWVDDLAFNADIGYGNFPGTVQNGRRMSTGKGHLAKVAQRPNLHVIKNAHVTRLNFDPKGEHVQSVSFELRNQQFNIHVGKEVVLSAGTLDSPKLLQLSGVGPAKHLQALNIPLVHDLPVGDNLQDHLHIPLYIQIDENVVPPVSAADKLDSIYNYLIHKRGPLASSGTLSLTGFINSLKTSENPSHDIELHHIYFRRGDYEGIKVYLNGISVNEIFRARLLKLIETGDVLVIFNILSHPKSTGHVRLRSADYRDAPKITHNYLNHPDDVETVLRGIRYIEQLEKTAAFREHNAHIAHVPIEECDVLPLWSDDYWRCYMKYFSLSSYHITGTVKMGADADPTSCVDTRLRLRGVGNVRVADASVMPDVPSANTNAPTIMIAERAVDFLREDWSNKMEHVHGGEL